MTIELFAIAIVICLEVFGIGRASCCGSRDEADDVSAEELAIAIYPPVGFPEKIGREFPRISANAPFQRSRCNRLDPESVLQPSTTKQVRVFLFAHADSGMT